MKVIHIASLKTASANPGVVQQMEWEQAAARQLGLDWDVELWTTEPAPHRSVLRQVPRGMQSFLLRRLRFHLRLRRVARTHDQIIIRHAPLDPFSLFVPRRIRRKTWYVSHTKMGDYLRGRVGRAGPALAWFDRLFTRRAVGGAAGIIGVTEELLANERARLSLPDAPGLVYPNGLFLADWGGDIPDTRGGAYKIVFVASRFFDWNGLEVVLESIVANPVDTPWELHLVGRMLPHQQVFVTQHGLQDRVIEHGVLNAGQIAALMAAMDLSLGAFALHKIASRTACTLKVRESLGAGVPVYAGHEDVGVTSIPTCYRVGPPDWRAILDMATVARSHAKPEIRCLARPGVDKERLIRVLYNGLC